MSRSIGITQQGILKMIADHGWYYPGCGWTWDGDTNCIKVCETLVTRGLLNKIPMAIISWRTDYRYELTDAGTAMIRTLQRREPVPVHLKFGYSVFVEKDAIRARLVAEGETDPTKLYLGVEAAYIEAHKNDYSLRQRQEEARRKKQAEWLEEEAKKPRPPEPILFTIDELERLVEHFESANDPVSASIGQKAQAVLKASGAQPPSKSSEES